MPSLRKLCFNPLARRQHTHSVPPKNYNGQIYLHDFNNSSSLVIILNIDILENTIDLNCFTCSEQAKGFACASKNVG